MKKAAVSSFLVVAVLLAVAVIAVAQQPKKIPRIGYLSGYDPATESTLSEAIPLALRKLGYIEGPNIAVEYRYAKGKVDRFPELAAELVRLKVDIIMVSGGLALVQFVMRFVMRFVMSARSCNHTKGDIDDWDRTFRVNLRAPMILAKMFLPAMIGKGEGAVINISSVSGKTGEGNGAAYAASKFGLIGFTQSLYEEVREHGIKVAVILPGYVDTALIPPNRQLDRSKMIQADDIAQAVNYVLTSPTTCCPVEITVRPQRTPYR